MISRNSVQDFARACHLADDGGLRIASARFDGINFGYWHIEVLKEGRPARQLKWEAREGWFIIQTQQTNGSWVDDEIVREPQAATLEDLMMRLNE